MSDVKFSCPRCDQHIVCDDALSGSTPTCPACGLGIIVPKPGEQVVPVPDLATEKIQPPLSSETSPTGLTSKLDDETQLGAQELLHLRRAAAKASALAVVLGTLNVALGALVLAGRINHAEGTAAYAAIVSLILGGPLLIAGSGCFFRQAWAF